MQLCIATPLYPPDIGGPATYARLLEDFLPSAGFEVRITKFGTVRWLPPGIRHVIYLLLLLKAAKDCDLLLALDPVSVGLPAAITARILRKPLVVKIVGDYAWEQGRQRFGVTESLDRFRDARSLAFEVRMLQRIESWVAGSAVRIIVPSDYLKRIVSTWPGVAAERIEVIYNAMREEEPAEIPEAVRLVPSPRIVSIGRLVPWKQVDGVIDAVGRIENASLIVVGDGPSRERLERRAREHAPGRVAFTGALPHAETLAVLAHADVFVLNSTYEGLSHLLIEALSLGVPSIATSVGGNPELVIDGDNGLLIPARDTNALEGAIERLLSDGALRERLGTSARASAKRFTVSSMIAKTSAFLRTCL